MDFFYLNKLLYFISLIILRHSLPCITEGIGHSLKNNYTSGKQERDMGRDKEIMRPLRMPYFLYGKKKKRSTIPWGHHDLNTPVKPNI